jgi:hypothetical protein
MGHLHFALYIYISHCIFTFRIALFIFRISLRLCSDPQSIMLSFLSMDQPSGTELLNSDSPTIIKGISKSVRSKRGDGPGMELAVEQEA